MPVISCKPSYSNVSQRAWAAGVGFKVSQPLTSDLAEDVFGWVCADSIRFSILLVTLGGEAKVQPLITQVGGVL